VAGSWKGITCRSAEVSHFYVSQAEAGITCPGPWKASHSVFDGNQKGLCSGSHGVEAADSLIIGNNVVGVEEGKIRLVRCTLYGNGYGVTSHYPVYLEACDVRKHVMHPLRITSGVTGSKCNFHENKHVLWLEHHDGTLTNCWWDDPAKAGKKINLKPAARRPHNDVGASAAAKRMYKKFHREGGK